MNGSDGVPSWAKGLSAVIAALGVALVAVLATGVFDCDCDNAPTATRTVPVIAGVQVDPGHKQSVAEQHEAAAKPFSADPDGVSLTNAGPDIHEDARDETPPGISPDEAAEALVTPPGVGKPMPPVGAQNYRCTTHLVRNRSARAPGVRVSQFVLHFTVSAPGSLFAIRNLFDRPDFAASSHLLLELDGECEQIVPYAEKAWTEGAFNSSSESVEIVTNDLSREQWLASPIISRGTLASIVADRLRARGLPPRLVDPVGCSPQAGVTDHSRLECGNTHWDVGRNFPWDVFMAQVRRAYDGTAPVCDATCQARQRQTKVVEARVRKHAALHVVYRAGGCRRGMHHQRLRTYENPSRCRALKRRGHAQHLGITRAKRKLRGIGG